MVRNMPSDKAQLTRFQDAARELGCDDDEAAFDAKLGKLAQAKVEPAPKLAKAARPKKVRLAKQS